MQLVHVPAALEAAIIPAIRTGVPGAEEDRHDAAQRAALDARGAARLAGLSEAEQEAAAQSAFAAIAGTPESW